MQKGSEIINAQGIALSGDGSIALTSNRSFSNSNGSNIGLVRMFELNLIDSLKLQNSEIDYVTKETKLEITFKTDVTDLTIDMITVDNGIVVSNLVKEGLKWIADIVFPDGVSNEAVKYTINVNYAENASKTLIKLYNTFTPIIGGTSALDIVSNIPETTTEDEKSFILPSLLNPTQLTIGTALEKRAKRKEFIKRLLKNKKEQLKSSAKKLVMNTSELLGTNDTVKKSKMRILDSYNSEGNVETDIAFDITTLGVDEGVYVPLENVGESVLLTTTNNKIKFVKVSESTYDVYEGYVDETSVVTKTMNDDETGVYDKFSYVLGSVGGELQTLESISMENIINPNTTGTLTITFNQAIEEANLKAYVSLNPAYIGTLGDITSADGGLTYTGTVTLNEGINRINNKVNLNYNGITGEASYDVVESDGVTITNQVLEKEYKDDTITKRYVAKISPDGSHVGVIDLRAGYDTLSTIIYEYDSNTNDYVQKGSVLKTGTMIEFSNDGSYVLIGVYKPAVWGYNSKLYYYKYNPNNNDWEIKGPNDYLHFYHGSGGDGISDISIDGSGKKIAMTTFATVRVYDYDDINNTITETNLGGFETHGKIGKISNDGNVLYVTDYLFRMTRYNYNGTNWTSVYYKTINGTNVPELGEAGINNVEYSYFNISNDGKLMAITGSRMYVPGSTDIYGDDTNKGNKTIILEYDEINNEFSVKGNIISHPIVLVSIKSIDITGNGTRVVVGDPREKYDFSEKHAEGMVEVYDYNSVTNNWDLYTRILGGGGEKDNFGANVSITSDGTKITGTNHNEYGGATYENKNYNTNPNIVQEYSRVYKLERGIERKIISMSMSDTTIKFPENGATFEVKFSTNDKTIGEVQGGLTLDPITAGTLTNVTMGNNGFSLVGTYDAATQTETTGNKLKYVEGELSAEVEFVLSTAEKAISNICFRGEAKVLTSEGYMEIREVKRGMKVQGEEIEEVTRTISKESEVVLMKRGSIMKNMPLEDTVITKEHKVLYKGEMVEAKELVNGSSIVYEKYKGETLYNILLSGEGKMVVNGMIVETLSPSNNIAKLYKIMKEYREEERREIVKIYNEERKRKSNGKKG